MKLLFLAVLMPSLALAGKPKPAKSGEVPTTVPLESARYQNAHLYGGQVPAEDLGGRFAPPETLPLDETLVKQTACSQYFSWEERPMSAFDGVFLASAAAAGFHKVPVEGAEVPVYVGFEAEPRQVAVINDPVALSQCCAQGDRCEDHFVSELISGKGRVFYAVGDDPSTRTWYRAGKVKGPIGFRLAGNPYGGDECGVWRESPPHTNVGRFFLGVSNTLYNEANAKEAALHAARNQARDYLRGKGLGDGVMQKIREERWCIETFPDEQMNDQWLAYVLIYLPEKSE